MSQLQASLSGIHSTGPRFRVKSKGGRLSKINSRTPKLPTGLMFAPALNERAMVQRVIAGDPNALDQLFAVHTTMLYRSAFRVLRNKEDAEDAVQDCLCRAYSKLRSFEGRSSFSTWLFRIVINSALMIRRKKNCRPEVSLEETLDTKPKQLPHRFADARPNPEEMCDITNIKGLMEEQIRQLPPALQSAVRIRDIDGLSTADTALALGIHQSALKSRLSRARRKLADGLQQLRQRPVFLRPSC